jgi:peptidoglycan/xylan/chitin deacetylase (PgdA/CDA1 family)
LGLIRTGCALALYLAAWPAVALACENPDAIGTSRTLAVDPAKFARVGTIQYRETLPLQPKEVVLTFDDGPMPDTTPAALKILREHCVKATFFLIGRNARANSELARRIARDGHTIGTHSENHPLNFDVIGQARGAKEIEDGFRTVAAALAPAGVLPAPFFRFPGLKTTHALEAYARSRHISVMSADFLADDWYRIGPQEVLARGLRRLEQKGSGIMLLHDVQPSTVLMLPQLLKELKKRGYSIVHLVPASSPAPLVADAVPTDMAPNPVAAFGGPAAPATAAARPQNGTPQRRRAAAAAKAKETPVANIWPRILGGAPVATTDHSP